MLELTYHDEQYMATRNSYPYKDALKSVAPWPDILFDGELRVWLVNWRCWHRLVEVMGEVLCASPDFWLCFPEVPPVTVYKPRRRSKRQLMAEKRVQQEAASQVGKAIVENGKELKW